MFKLRLAILGAAATLALGTAGALAMEAAGTNNSDSHGDAVASAARNCPTGAGGVHGACVSSVARTQGQSGDNNTSGKATAPGQVCKVAESTETEPTDRAAAKAEDRAEQQAFVACVKAHAAAQTDTGS
ncbi:MAG TPA: hypothetical protein VFK22_03600 [Candidatus Dormibacteraeota bacterium]|nr:hypothetical protein [Candidatus Dormibacteraeota bacterium]